MSWFLPLLAISLHAPVATVNAADTLAITDVSVLPMDGPGVLEHQTVVTADGRIVALGAAGKVRVPSGARSIDGRGKYLLPGLADMHVHLSTADEFPMYVGNGVLTLRDLNGSPRKLGWRKAIAAGTMVGPRLFVSGPMIAGSEIPWPNKVVPKTADEARALVLAQKAAGYDQIKIYDGIPKEVFQAAIETATKERMLSSGHIPESVGFDGVLASGMTGLEHLDKTVYATVGDNLDPLQIPSIVARIKASRMWVTPTLESMIQISKAGSGRFDSLMTRPEALSSPPDLREFWTSISSHLKGNRALPAGARCDRYCDFQLRLAGALARAGVPMLAGTDLPNVVLVPGYSLHGELDALALAGLTPYQVLQSATSAPARLFGQESDWGSVAVGRRANLILVDGNPLKDLRTLRDPAGVLLAGRWIERPELRSMRRAEGALPRPVAAFDDSIIALEKQSWVAWQKRDGRFFQGFLSDDHLEVGPGGVVGKTSVVASVASPGYVVASYTVDHFVVTRIEEKVAVLTYRADQQTRCGTFVVPSPAWATSVYVLRDGRWVNAVYQQTTIPPK
ncbi:MAG: amidohydrolase family protein [Gemmatimonadota bacterium]|nr:amidohydrolase family protein [Gemmatimonadota bacterium]